jgi:type II secretory pathway component PulK
VHSRVPPSKAVNSKPVGNKLMDNKVLHNKVVGSRAVNSKVVCGGVVDNKALEGKVANDRVVGGKAAVDNRAAAGKVAADNKVVSGRVVDNKAVGDRAAVDNKAVGDRAAVDNKAADGKAAVDNKAAGDKVVRNRAGGGKAAGSRKQVARKIANEVLAETMLGVAQKKGLVLVAVLWIVVLLTVIVATVGRSSMLDTRVRLLRTEELRCKWACRAGIEKAVALLNEDTRESDHLLELWSYNDTDFNNVSLEGCWYNVRVTDEAGKLNINTATKEQLMGLPYMEEYIADAIIDWRDKDDTPSGLGVEGGYYENLPFRYTIRNGPFRTIRELLLVRDVTEQLLYGEDTNFNGKLDYNEQDGDESPPPDDRDDELDKGWISFLTCYSYSKNVDAEGNARININQADENQLQQSLGLSSSVARAIVQRRSNSQFTSIVDLVGPSTSTSTGSGSSGAAPAGQSATLDMQTFYQIADKITVDGQQQVPGKVNINTAPKEVLVALLGGDDQAWQVAEKIVAYREVLADGMQSIAELLEYGLVNLDAFRKIASSITTRSDVFTIRCFATASRGLDSGLTLQAETVVDRSSSPYKILYRYQGASN